MPNKEGNLSEAQLSPHYWSLNWDSFLRCSYQTTADNATKANLFTSFFKTFISLSKRILKISNCTRIIHCYFSRSKILFLSLMYSKTVCDYEVNVNFTGRIFQVNPVIRNVDGQMNMFMILNFLLPLDRRGFHHENVTNKLLTMKWRWKLILGTQKSTQLGLERSSCPG